jgi:hypothetical protein
MIGNKRSRDQGEPAGARCGFVLPRNLLAKIARFRINAGMGPNSITTFLLLLMNFLLVPAALVDRHAVAPMILQMGLIVSAVGAVLVIWRPRRRNFRLLLLVPAYSAATFLGNVYYMFYYRG